MVSPADRDRVTALINDRNSPRKHVGRKEIVLLGADGVGTAEIMRRASNSKTGVWRWLGRFAHPAPRRIRVPRRLADEMQRRLVLGRRPVGARPCRHWLHVLAPARPATEARCDTIASASPDRDGQGTPTIPRHSSRTALHRPRPTTEDPSQTPPSSVDLPLYHNIWHS